GAIGELELEDINTVISNRAVGEAAYLTGLTTNSVLDMAWQAPLRMVYLLFSPFPWDIRSPSHILGLLDGLLYLTLVYLVVKRRAEIFGNRTLLALCIIVGILTLAFAFGTSNFGTAN